MTFLYSGARHSRHRMTAWSLPRRQKIDRVCKQRARAGPCPAPVPPFPAPDAPAARPVRTARARATSRAPVRTLGACPAPRGALATRLYAPEATRSRAARAHAQGPQRSHGGERRGGGGGGGGARCVLSVSVLGTRPPGSHFSSPSAPRQRRPLRAPRARSRRVDRRLRFTGRRAGRARRGSQRRPQSPRRKRARRSCRARPSSSSSSRGTTPPGVRFLSSSPHRCVTHSSSVVSLSRSAPPHRAFACGARECLPHFREGGGERCAGLAVLNR